MAHCKKFTRAACGHMWKHYERAKDENGEYVKFGNQDIDTSKSHLNYNLAPIQHNGQGGFVKERCSEVKMQNRKDVNVMCSWVVTAPKEVQENNETEIFFRETYKFLSERYGRENVVSAYVHMDETTPHMHFAFVPVVMDKKKNIPKVSAKEAIDKKELQIFHEDLLNYMVRTFGRDMGILNEATKEGNQSIAELKSGTAKKELEEMKEQAQHYIKLRERNQEAMSKVAKDITSLQDKKQGLGEEIKELEKIFKGKKMTVEEIEKINPIKNLFGNINNISMEDIKNLKRMAMTTRKDSNELKKAKEEVEKLKKENKTLESKVPTMAQRLKEGERKMKIQELEEENAEQGNLISKIIAGVNRLPEKEREYMQNIINPPQENGYTHDEWER